MPPGWIRIVADVPRSAYSYNFVGMVQTLDSQFATDGQFDDLVEVRAGHFNADLRNFEAVLDVRPVALLARAVYYLLPNLAPFNIRVVSINPYATDTPMLRAQLAEQDSDEGQRARLAAIPLGRLLAASDVAHAALYLASDEAAMVTGTAFEIDGGRLV